MLRYSGHKGKEGRRARKRGGREGGGEGGRKGRERERRKDGKEGGKRGMERREGGWLYALQTGNKHAVLHPLEITFLLVACIQ